MIQSTVAAFDRNSADVAGTERSFPRWPVYSPPPRDSLPKDHFVQRNGIEFAGTHVILDMWGARQLDDLELMEHTLRRSVIAAGATLLHVHLHHFTPEGGISGVAVLAESHISVHTWPERDFAAFDVFMCGEAEPAKAIRTIEIAFNPERVKVQRYLRGVVPHDETVCRDAL